MLEQILSITEEMGISVEDKEASDINLQELLVDSIQFIDFILHVEKAFNIEIPDEYLIVDTVSSLNNFMDILTDIIKNNKESEIL
jgi:acyl carrier protein